MRAIPERWRELLGVALVFAALLPAGVVVLGLTGTGYTGYQYVTETSAGVDPGVGDESVITAVEYVEPFSAEQWWAGAAIVFAAWAMAIALLVGAYTIVRPAGRHGQRAWRRSAAVGVILWSAGVAGMSVVASAVHRANWREWWEFAPTEPLARRVMTTPEVGREAALMYLPIAIVVAGLLVLAAMGYLRVGGRSGRGARVAGGVAAGAQANGVTTGESDARLADAGIVTAWDPADSIGAVTTDNAGHEVWFHASACAEGLDAADFRVGLRVLVACAPAEDQDGYAWRARTIAPVDSLDARTDPEARLEVRGSFSSLELNDGE